MDHETIQTTAIIVIGASSIGANIIGYYNTKSCKWLSDWLEDLSEIVSHKRDE